MVRKKQAYKKWTLTRLQLNFPVHAKIFLFPGKISLFVRLGNLAKSPCGTATFRVHDSSFVSLLGAYIQRVRFLKLPIRSSKTTTPSANTIRRLEMAATIGSNWSER